MLPTRSISQNLSAPFLLNVKYLFGVVDDSDDRELDCGGGDHDD
jgi:hypothetical protein